jgi:hypothetical protein
MNVRPILAKMARPVLMDSILFLVLASPVTLVLCAKRISTNVLPILAKMARLAQKA